MVVSDLTNRTPLCGPKLLLLTTAISFFNLDPLECVLFRKGEKGILQGGSRGSEGSKENNLRDTKSSGFQDTTHVTRRHYLPLGSADLLLPSKKRFQVASFQTPLILLRANSHQAPRGEWLQVTKELHSDRQSKRLLPPGCGPGRGKWENDRIQGWPE